MGVFGHCKVSGGAAAAASAGCPPAAAAVMLDPRSRQLNAPVLFGYRRLLLLLIVARFTFNALLRGPTTRLAARHGADEQHRDGSRLLEELWVTAGNLLMLAAAARAMLRHNGGCSFFNTAPCLAGWPSIGAAPQVVKYYQLELAWYLHMLLKPLLRYGLAGGWRHLRRRHTPVCRQSSGR